MEVAMGAFDGFPSQTVEFLKGLRANNSKAWLDAHRADYEAGYVEPAKRFVEACGRALIAFAPQVQAEPRVLGSIFRINRDIRFSKDKTPYKDHLDLWFWEGERKSAVSGFFVRITPDVVVIGGGCHGFDPKRLQAFRAAVAEKSTGLELARIVDQLRRDGLEVGGVGYKRPPAGFSAPAAAEPLLLHNALFAHRDEQVDDRLGDGRILDVCVDHWRRMAPLHYWLVTNVQSMHGQRRYLA
jgi:uncharacterized protein (TIGR02453 family)